MSSDTDRPAPWRLRGFIGKMACMLEADPAEQVVLDQGRTLLADLIAHDDWLPDAFATPGIQRYQQYLLHCDSRARFSVVSFVWAPGQSTPVHNHGVWGLVGMLRGSEIEQPFTCENGMPTAQGPARRLWPGDVASISPATGDIHQVRNAMPDEVSISIHVYGGDIGAVQRSVFTAAGKIEPFVSGYANAVLPNIWGAAKF